MKDRKQGVAPGSMLRGMLLIASGIAMWVYLGWRVWDTIPDGVGMWFGVGLLIAEGVQALQSSIFYLTLFNPTKRVPPTLSDQPWTVDVLITTYNEPLDILKRTVAACKNLEYPTDRLQIWLCDDGRREDVRRLAEEWGVGYLSRPTNEHAKAGNLNNALQHTSGELIVTLDADMIPKPNFLQRTAGFFRDEELAFVQIPQSFYNEDIFQYNLFQSRGIPNDQDLFMRLIQAGRDRYNAAIFLGTNTVFRRTALESIGGFITGTITEDLATGMILQSKGYQSVFLNEVLAEGLATESFPDLVIQRIRWARGNIQILRRWNPLFLPGLKPMQRLMYTSGIMYWYFGLWKLVFFLSPLVYLGLGIPILDTELNKILIFWLPHFLLSAITLRLLTGNMRDLFWSHVYDTALGPSLTWAALVETLTRKEIPFRVTPKGVTAGRVHFHKRLAGPQMVLLILSLAAMYRGVTLLGTGDLADEAIYINMFWTAYNIVGLVAAVMLGVERPRLRNSERFERSYKINLITVGDAREKLSAFGTALDVSETGCRLLLQQVVPLREQVLITIYGRKTHEIRGKVVYFDTHSNGFQAAIQFESFTPEAYREWVREVYGEQPDESNFQLQSGSGWVSMFLKYLMNFRIQYKPKSRTSPRITTKITCQLQLLPSSTMRGMEEMAATDYDSFKRRMYLTFSQAGEIRDIGLHGCQVWLKSARSCKAGDGIAITLPGASDVLIGHVVRVQSSHTQGILLGIKWMEETTGLRMMADFGGQDQSPIVENMQKGKGAKRPDANLGV